MVVLSYDKARRTIIMMAVYLVLVAFAVRGLSVVLNHNLTSMIDSATNGSGIRLSLPTLPEFNLDSFSFEMLKSIMTEKAHKFIDVIFASAVGFANAGLLKNQLLQLVLFKNRLI